MKKISKNKRPRPTTAAVAEELAAVKETNHGPMELWGRRKVRPAPPPEATFGPREGYARNALSRWLCALEDPDPLRKKKADDDSSRAFTYALERITDSAVDSFGADAPEPIRSAIIIAAYRLVGTFEQIAKKHPDAVQRLSELWTEFPALVPILDGDRKHHLDEMRARIKPGSAAAGAAKLGRKSHSTQTPINQFLVRLLNRGIIEYKGRQYEAPWMGGDINNPNPVPPPPPRPPYTRQEAKRVIDEWIIPALADVIRGDIKRLESVRGLEGVLNPTRYNMRNPRADRSEWKAIPKPRHNASAEEWKRYNRLCVDAIPPKDDEVWKKVKARIIQAMTRMKIIRV